MRQDRVPIIEVTDKNFSVLWQTIVSAIEQASFISIDLELSGLGERKKLNCPEIDMRYQYLTEIASSHAIISFGISCFTYKVYKQSTDLNSSSGTKKSHKYLVQTFNFITLPAGRYVVESASAKFLVSHGFDFNKQYSNGLLFTRGDDSAVKNASGASIRDIFTKIIKHEKPVVFHNGFLDLVFLYQNFYAELPKDLQTFSSDLCNMFPNGIYDTKYIADYENKWPASYLEFVFRKSQLMNKKQKDLNSCYVEETFLPYPRTVPGLNWLPYLQIFATASSEVDAELCSSYKYHGWCSKGSKCEQSHDMNRITRNLHSVCAKTVNRSHRPHVMPISDVINRIKSSSNVPKGEKRKRDSSPIKEPCVPNTPCSDEPTQAGHRAGFDAFMTGYIFGCHIAILDQFTDTEGFNPKNLGTNQIANRVYLGSKSFPFLIQTSIHSKMSLKHLNKIQKIKPIARLDMSL